MRKKLLLCSVAILIMVSPLLHAQRLDFPIRMAKDFTVRDINGTVHHLYDYLDSGKVVFLDVSATWCPPCWSFHQTHAMQEMHTRFGPEGTEVKDMVVLWFDGSTGTRGDLNGVSSNSGQPTQGNWLTGSDYPFILTTENSGNTIMADYGVMGYPSLFMIYPDRTVVSVGPMSADDYREEMLKNSDAIHVVDSARATLRVFKGVNPLYHCSAEFTPQVLMNNTGRDTLKSASLSLLINGQEVETKDLHKDLVFAVDTAIFVFQKITRNPGVYEVKINLVEGGAVMSTLVKDTFKVIGETLTPASLEVDNSDWLSLLFAPFIRETDDLDLKAMIAPANMNFFGTETARMVSPPYDMRSLQKPAIRFQWSFAQIRYEGQLIPVKDEFLVRGREACQTTTPRTTFMKLSGNQMVTRAPENEIYIPRDDTWRDTIVLLENVGDVVQLEFLLRHKAGGNLLWLRNIKVGEYDVFASTTSIDKQVSSKIMLAPNPANHETSFMLSLDANAILSYSILNTLGQVVYTSPKQAYEAGEHIIRQDVSMLPVGTYVVSFNINGILTTEKLNIIR